MHALLIGAPGLAARAEELGRYGADAVIVVEHGGLEHYSAEVVAATTAERLRSGGYRAGIFAASAQGRDLAPRVAARLGAALASDVTEFEIKGPSSWPDTRRTRERSSSRSGSRASRRSFRFAPGRSLHRSSRVRHESNRPRPRSIRARPGWS